MACPVLNEHLFSPLLFLNPLEQYGTTINAWKMRAAPMAIKLKPLIAFFVLSLDIVMAVVNSLTRNIFDEEFRWSRRDRSDICRKSTAMELLA
jgi:hypothetical protein